MSAKGSGARRMSSVRLINVSEHYKLRYPLTGQTTNSFGKFVVLEVVLGEVDAPKEGQNAGSRHPFCLRVGYALIYRRSLIDSSSLPSLPLLSIGGRFYRLVSPPPPPLLILLPFLTALQSRWR